MEGEKAYKEGPKSIEFWNWQNAERLGDPVPMPSHPLVVRYHPGGKWLAVGCQGGEIIRVDPEKRTAEELLHFEMPCGRPDFCPFDMIDFADTVTGEVLVGGKEGRNQGSGVFVWDIAA